MSEDLLNIAKELSEKPTTELALQFMELTADNITKEKEIDRLNSMINQADNKNLELIQKINKIYDVIENRNITGIEARLLIQDILDKEE